MRRLAEALGAWAPAEGAGAADPVVLLGAAWNEIVGPENARNSHPAQLTGDTLMIVTASSVWSAQLSYLSEQIVATLAARLPRAGIEKVRFRVGKLPVRSSHSRATRVIERVATACFERAGRRRARSAGALSGPASTTAQRAKRARGWKECTGLQCLDWGNFRIALYVVRNRTRGRAGTSDLTAAF